jgi:hypothetical protein
VSQHLPSHYSSHAVDFGRRRARKIGQQQSSTALYFLLASSAVPWLPQLRRSRRIWCRSTSRSSSIVVNAKLTPKILFCKVSSMQTPHPAVNDPKYRKQLALLARKIVIRWHQVSGASFSPADDILVRVTHEDMESSALTGTFLPTCARLNTASAKMG